jgi:DNA-binding response OmpR family regulator
MGGLSGIETVRELRLIRPEIPIIISSGLGRDEVADRLGEIEAPAAFLRKPYRLANLSGVLAQVLSNGGPH